MLQLVQAWLVLTVLAAVLLLLVMVAQHLVGRSARALAALRESHADHSAAPLRG